MSKKDNSKPIKQVKALGVDIEPSEVYDWCYVFKDGIYVGKIKWIEIDETLLKIRDIVLNANTEASP